MQNKGLTLIGSYPSPYVRSLRLFLYKRVPFTFKSIDYLNPEEGAYLARLNPIHKIPVLLHDDKIIFESRIIYQYVKKEFLLYETLSIEEENLLSAIYGVMDTTINLFMMRRFGNDIHADNNYFHRNHTRIKSLHAYLTSQLYHLSSWKFPAMLLYSYLDWANMREMIKLDELPELKKFHQEWQDLESVQATKIPI
ncbi:MAG: glutathione S-transferase family protein [Bacteriovoracaceae bacterium]